MAEKRKRDKKVTEIRIKGTKRDAKETHKVMWVQCCRSEGK